ELGLVGLLLLAIFLALPIIAARRVRDPLVTAALASYCGFLVHAGFEWDWEMPIVVISALALASTLVLSNGRGHTVHLAAALRFSAAAIAASLGGFSVIALAGNSYLVAAEHRLAAGDVQGAHSRATTAMTLLPWSSEPSVVVGDGDLEAGDLARSA